MTRALKIHVLDDVRSVLNAAETRCQPSFQDRINQVVLVPITVALEVRSLATASNHLPKRCTVQQQPPLHVRIRNRLDDLPRPDFGSDS